MNYNESVNYLSDKKIILDLEVVEDASKKWNGKKLVVNTEPSRIPFDITKGTDISGVVRCFSDFLEHEVENLENNISKHYDLVFDFLEHCVKAESIRDSSIQFKALSDHSRKMVNTLLDLTSDLHNFNTVFSNTKIFYDIENIINSNKGQWNTPSLFMLESYPYVKVSYQKPPITPKTVNIVFQSSDISKLKVSISKLNIEKISKKIETLSSLSKKYKHSFNKRAELLLLASDEMTNKYKGKEFNHELSVIAGMVENLYFYFESSDDVSKFFNKIIASYQDAVVVLAKFVKESVKLADRTDSWIFSKNV